MHVQTKELPESIRSALESVGYHRADIEVETKEHVSLFNAGSAGRKAFAVLLDIETGTSRHVEGSYGGPNMFNPANVVDRDTREHALPVGGAVILGMTGGGTHPVMAKLVLHPKNVVPWLSAESNELTEHERGIMYCFGCVKPGEYRKNALRAAKATDGDIDALVNKGFLKRDGRGVQITTAGKNTRRASAASSKW